ncbi:MAG: DUF6390 family protein [Acidothermaceae bacterium]
MNSGERLFARYAYAPNDLGYCGPAETAELFELGATSHSARSIRPIAERFSGAWPYAQLLAEVAGIDDPLDERVMRAYWTGSPLLDAIDREAFGIKLIDRFGSEAGHYWAHLTPDLLPEAMPTHGFHVFGVYPWSRLLCGDTAVAALQVLDNCRIRWGQVERVDGAHVVVRSERLTWDGRALALGHPATERVRLSMGGVGFVDAPVAGEWLALHWDWVCERLTTQDLDCLQRWTTWQLSATNARLASTEPRRASPPSTNH